MMESKQTSTRRGWLATMIVVGLVGLFAGCGGDIIVAEDPDDPCINSQCKNDSVCVATEDFKASCHCLAGFEGTYCEIEIDECDPNPCENGGSCEDEVDGYSCTCKSGYSGKSCEIADGSGCIPNPCQNGGTCTALDGNDYSCECPDGFSGPSCEINIDECDPNPCQNGGTCTDGDNSYTCECAEGFTGDMCEVAEGSACDPNPC